MTGEEDDACHRVRGGAERARCTVKLVLGARGGASHDEFALPFMSDEVIGDVSALQYSAAPANEALRRAVPGEIRQGAVLFELPA
jgi:hypothetical protein